MKEKKGSKIDINRLKFKYSKNTLKWSCEYEGQDFKRGETRSMLTQQKEKGAKKVTRYTKKELFLLQYS
jgi:CRISPR/Cas system CMR-associated protein Cmr5 small subunit